MTGSYQSHYVMVCALQGLVWADVMQDYCTVTQQDWIRLWQELGVVLNRYKTICVAIPLCYCGWTDVMQAGCTQAPQKDCAVVVPKSSGTIGCPKQSSWYAVQSLVWTDMMQDGCTLHSYKTIWIYIQNWTDMMQGYCTSASKRWYKALSVHAVAPIITLKLCIPK